MTDQSSVGGFASYLLSWVACDMSSSYFLVPTSYHTATFPLLHFSRLMGDVQ